MGLHPREPEAVPPRPRSPDCAWAHESSTPVRAPARPLGKARVSRPAAAPPGGTPAAVASMVIDLGRRDPDRDQLAGPVQQGETSSIRRSIFTWSPGTFGMSDGAMTSQRTPSRWSGRWSSQPVGSGLVAGPNARRVRERADELSDRGLVVEDPLGDGVSSTGSRMATEIESR